MKSEGRGGGGKRGGRGWQLFNLLDNDKTFDLLAADEQIFNLHYIYLDNVIFRFYCLSPLLKSKSDRCFPQVGNASITLTYIVEYMIY